MLSCVRVARLGALPLAVAGVAARAELPPAEIVVTGQAATARPTPGSVATIDSTAIRATINAVNVEDVLKYLPSLVVRKRHIGDTQAPLATRTSGVGASARSLIYADGALLSALIGNNNTIASPRWGLVSPEEVARVDVLYGPFAAAYPGNSIGAVVNITTRLPDKLEASAVAGAGIQRFAQYGTRATLPVRRVAGTVGDRFGPLAIFLSAARVTSDSQPLAYVTATRGAVAAGGVAVSGGFADVNRLGQPINVIGAGGFEHQRQDTLKAKAALDLSSAVRLTYVAGLFLNDTSSTAESYLTGVASGLPAYAGAFSVGGVPTTVAAGAFSNNVYRYEERHWSHSLSLTGTGAIEWRVIGTRYRFSHDVQRIPSIALPAATTGGAGSIVRLNGTGWDTGDASAAGAIGTHRLSAGAHWDRFLLANERYATADWIAGPAGAPTTASRGRTRTQALWAEEAWSLVPAVTLTLGARAEWWRASRGFNFSATPALAVAQPTRRDDRLSPKASLAWTPGNWRLALAWGQAWRFPTVTELYQAVTTGPAITVPDPSLRPERARSTELSAERRDGRGTIRLSLFAEDVRDALISQSAPLVPGSGILYSYVQNVGRTRTRGIEAAFDRRDLLPRLDLSGSVTLVDAEIRANPAVPASVGKDLPQVPRRKATIVATWRPVDRLSLTAAGRFANRSFGTIDNTDTVAHTYQGFEGYRVVDLRAKLDVTPRWSLAVGVDNVFDERYYLFHPFPQRMASVELAWRL